MSRLWMPALACALALALSATPAFAQTADVIREFGQHDPPEILAAAIKEKVDFDGSKIGDMKLTEVLQKLATKHKVTFVIADEEFKAKKFDDIQNKKSRVKQLDTKDMTIAEFLDAWLPSLGATYKIHADYVAVVPLPLKVQEPNPVMKLREKPGVVAENPKKADKTEQIITILSEQEVDPPKGDIRDFPLFEILSHLSKQHSLTFVINEESFKEWGNPNIKEEKPKFSSTELRGLHLHQFLRVTLGSMGATYLIRNNTVEIVSVQYAASLTKATLRTAETDSGGPSQLTEPLVSHIVKEKPLNETVAKIAEMYDLTVVVSPQAGDARTGFVSARLLNVPAEKALELLALQADLRVVRRGAAFLITSKDHANELFGEELEKERQKIELQKFRETPVKPPVPEKPPEQSKPEQ